MRYTAGPSTACEEGYCTLDAADIAEGSEAVPCAGSEDGAARTADDREIADGGQLTGAACIADAAERAEGGTVTGAGGGPSTATVAADDGADIGQFNGIGGGASMAM
jgi:hypothetical protein